MATLDSGDRRFYEGDTGTGDGTLVLQTNDVSALDTFTMMSTAGSVEVFASLDGTNYATAPLSLTDLGATDWAPVISTAANRIYGFAGPFKAVQIKQNGATAVTDFVMIGKRTAR